MWVIATTLLMLLSAVAIVPFSVHASTIIVPTAPIPPTPRTPIIIIEDKEDEDFACSGWDYECGEDENSVSRDGSGPPSQGECDPSYPFVCIPSPPPTLSCLNIIERNFVVIGNDPHNFDDDNDGVGCEL